MAELSLPFESRYWPLRKATEFYQRSIREPEAQKRAQMTGFKHNQEGRHSYHAYLPFVFLVTLTIKHLFDSASDTGQRISCGVMILAVG